MTWEQRDAFLEAVAAVPSYNAFFATLAKAGLRPGEAFTLKSEDVDLNERSLRVERAWSLGGPRGSFRTRKASRSTSHAYGRSSSAASRTRSSLAFASTISGPPTRACSSPPARRSRT
jgi:integrase